MAAIVDEVYEYRGYHGCQSCCRIRIYRPAGKPPVIIATEAAGQNPGTSITNLAEQIATDVTRIYRLAQEPFVWIEHYDDRSDPIALKYGIRRTKGESFDRVEFRQRGSELFEPHWRPIAKEAVEEMIGEQLP
jgi:hypothetical protein